MANIDEAFAALSDVQSVSVNENVDFVVDSYLRVISIPVRGVVLGVEGDKDVNRVTFRMSRTYKGVDMSQFQIRINYANANNELNYFKVTEITVSDDEIVFVWVVGADAVAYVGNVEFVVRFIKLSGSNIIQELNTTLATAKSLIGLSVDGEISPVQREDLLAHFYNEIDAYSETKKNEILDSIPEDYTALANEVDELKSDLVDFKDLADFADSNADSKDTLYIVDANGKIIATVSKEGIDTVGYKKHGEDFVPGSVDLLETYDDVFYIADGNGNVIFKASKDGIEGVNISASSPSPYKDKVLISIGDSLSAHDNWQKWLVEWYGVSFDADANVNGKDGHAPMAKGGTAVIPNSVDSIYIRALDAHYYNPNLIILYAGQNDVPHFGSATELNPTAVGTISDIPYRKTVPYTQLPESEYADYTSWYEGRPTLYSYCMGLVENLLESCPTAQIIVLTPMQMWTSDGTQSVGRKQLVTTWHEICNKYALPIIDLWNESGVNAFNMSEYYPNVGNVHPNDYGYKRIAETIYSKM